MLDSMVTYALPEAELYWVPNKTHLHPTHSSDTDSEDDNILCTLHWSGRLSYVASGMPVRGEVGADTL